MKPLLALLAVAALFYGNAVEDSWLIIIGGILAAITLVLSIRQIERK